MSSAADEFRRRLKDARERLVATNINDPALGACISGLARVEAALARPLRVVILGESNSGKTSVADLLIGEGLLPTSVVANTRVPVLISFAERSAVIGVDADGNRIRVDSSRDGGPADVPFRALQVALPLARLKAYQILDTPPSMAASTLADEADIVLWCTVATRAWTESERAIWTGLPARCRRHALLVATHRDGLKSDVECALVARRLATHTDGLFRDIVLVAAESEDGAAADEICRRSAQDLRDRVDGIAAEIAARRAHKADQIVRRLARLTFHRFARTEVRPETVVIISAWETYGARLIEALADGHKTVQATIEEMLVAYAQCAEMLKPGVVTGDSVSGSISRALSSPMRWPARGAAATRLVTTLASDLTGLLRMIAGGSGPADPASAAAYHAARTILLSLSDLDGAFDALGRMLGSSPSQGLAQTGTGNA